MTINIEKPKQKSLEIYPWGTSRPYNAYGDFIKKKFGSRVQKVIVDAGFSCPNRDGTLSAGGGCIYCNNASFNPAGNSPAKRTLPLIHRCELRFAGFMILMSCV